jgi:post-segregation antitoxin (ccd killing protein)
MKTKLTVTVDEELIPRAKAHARAHGTSLSQLIEDALRKATDSGDRPFSERWRGQFVAPPGDDPRRRALTEKYL